mgnify:FL=1
MDILISAGFSDVRVVEKQESREFIKDWLPGSGAEDFVVSANVTAVKPIGLTPGSDQGSKQTTGTGPKKWVDIVAAEEKKMDSKKQSSGCCPPSVDSVTSADAFADTAGKAFANAAGVDAAKSASVGKAVADLTVALGAVIKSLGEHHAQHTVLDGETSNSEPEPVVEEKAGC